MIRLFTFAFCLSLASCFTASFGQQFKVSYSASAYDKPFTGKVYLYLSKNNQSPKDASIGLEPLNAFSVTVKDIKPAEEVIINDTAVSYPVIPSEMERGEYNVQVVWDLNLGGRSISGSAGNLYSKSQKIVLTKDINKVFTLVSDQVIPAKKEFKGSDFVKEFKASSKLLSDFYQKNFKLKAAVQLPAEYEDQPERKFPVQFVIFGYGADYRSFGSVRDASEPLNTVPCITVYLDGNNPLGHSGYANSDNNGPWGDALVQEFIPMLEKKFRCNGARLLMGHSSGGWSALWLQTHYPKVFIACASSSPDYVDFRSFAKVDLYNDINLFYNKRGGLNPAGTVAGRFPFSYLKEIYQAENVISRGEQQHSFDAVFSKKGKDGLPESICDPKTGLINTVTVENWKKYDLSLYLRNNWSKLKDDLNGKIRISVGRDDNFLLNYPINLMNEEMKKLNASIIFKDYPGDHFTVATEEYLSDMTDFLEEKYLDWEHQREKNGR